MRTDEEDVKADTYNSDQLSAGELSVSHITELVRRWQRDAGLVVDGKAGPKTIDSIESSWATTTPDERYHVNVDGWMHGAGVKFVVTHPSWIGGSMLGGKPRGIVAHYSATAPGTAVNMASRRARKFGLDPSDRMASWHLTIDTDGSVVQMVSFRDVAWHAHSDTAKQISGLGWANQNCIGIELVGDGKSFPAAQVETACHVWRAIVCAYDIKAEFAMIEHSSIDPSRRVDPGPVWMREHAVAVLANAYA